MANVVSVLFEIDRDSQGRNTIRQIDRGLAGIGVTALASGRQVDAGIRQISKSAIDAEQRVSSLLGLFKGLLIVEFFRRGAEAAVGFGRDAVDSFNKAQAAAIGLSSVALFKGIDPGAANEAVRGLKIVRDGLLSISEASKSVQNLLATNFTLEQSIGLLNRLGDSAAFNRQASLGFGEAITRTTEGIRLGLSSLADGAGVAQNLGQMLKVAGIEASELSNISTNAAARMAIFNGFMRETEAQVGNASKLTSTFSGQLSKLEVTYDILLQTIGEQIAKNPEIIKGFDSITKSIQELIVAAATPGTEFNRTLTDLIEFAGKAADSLGDLIRFVREYAGELSTLIKVAGGLGAAFGINKILGSFAGALPGAASGAVASEATSSIRGRNVPDLGFVLFQKSSDALVTSFNKASKTVLDTDKILAAHNVNVAGATTAIGYLKERASSASASLKEFAAGGIRPGFGAIAGIAGVIGPLIAEAITGAIRKAAEERLSTASRNANLGLGEKSLSDREAEFERLKALVTTPGFGGLGGLKNVEQQIETTSKILAIQRQVEEAKKILSEIEKLRQEGAGLNIGDATKGIPSIEEFLKERGLPDFREFANRATASQSELDRLTGGQNLEIQKRLKAIESPSSSLISEESEKEKKALEKLVTDSESQLFTLQQRVTFDPVAKSIADTRRELDEFTKKFESLGPVVVNQGRALIEAFGRDEVFKASLAGADRLNKLLREQAQLTGVAAENARADQDRRLNFFEGQSGIQRQLDLLRFGEEDPTEVARRTIREASSELSGIALTKAIADATSGLSLDQLRSSGLDLPRRFALQELQQDQRTQLAEQLAREEALKQSTARQLASAQDFLGRATSDTQRQAVLDAILAATSDTRLLTPDQIEARTKAAEQQAELIAKTTEQQIGATLALVGEMQNLNRTLLDQVIVRVEAPDSANVDRLPKGFQ